MKQIAFETKASQDKFELMILLELLDNRKPERILEIGVDKGYLCETWRRAFPNAEVIGIDVSDSALEYKDFNFILADSHSVDTRDNLLANDHVSFDLIFIDGDHTYEGVRKDFELYAPLIKSGGIIAFHDIMRTPGQYEGVEVMRFWNEMRQRWANIEIWNGVLNKNSPGIGCLFL